MAQGLKPEVSSQCSKSILPIPQATFQALYLIASPKLQPNNSILTHPLNPHLLKLFCLECPFLQFLPLKFTSSFKIHFKHYLFPVPFSYYCQELNSKAGQRKRNARRWQSYFLSVFSLQLDPRLVRSQTSQYPHQGLHPVNDPQNSLILSRQVPDFQDQNRVQYITISVNRRDLNFL